ncbi:threonine dehydratase [Clostridium tetanomorphum]|uniref:L-threonine dehydratase catabolic TdcB n=2 Tax=Clostridium TaxID=1485 RepID=A0A923EDD2_CLOTT|nr:threonine ammonia-lyase [Clostridium tetanomorphum]KAJ52215.1 threonine dehydratase [Clostridium tetanomorphum DSM 665]MBC2399994.1 threonine ammonia-lyase [Clostridium tetanomorphum]MBP1863794.1 threonine dehydratase [Clostridium tetanomorphum]NRS86370.1 threonine dehydratase [Clostridium tetanomorphum]NRZ95600.1 threonine dehydratase [Clostridium tetanomorphum]
MSLDLGKIQMARENIKSIVRKTPLFYSSTFTKESGLNIYLKCENKQKTGAFKIRGAYNKIVSLTEEEKRKGVIASSAGNHAQGVAYAAAAFGIKSTIVMPITAPQAKVKATKGYGAEVIQYGEVYDECYSKALEVQKETGATFIHPFNDEQVIAGQGTIGIEILEDLPEADAIVVPIGGGGLISGIALAAKSIKPDIKIIGVQPSIIASSKASLDEGKIVTLPGVKSLADGISVKTPGDITFKYMQKYVDDIVTVSEDEIAYGIFCLIERSKLIAEGAGAAAIASILSDKVDLKGKNVVSLISGGNIDIASVSKIIDRELIILKRRIRFVVELQDKVGQLGQLVTNVVSMGANVVKVRQDNNWNEKGLDYANVVFEIEIETREHAQKVIDTLRKKGYNLEVID